MSNKILLAPEEHLLLRTESRIALSKLGVPSNQGFTNGNILQGLALALNLPYELGEVDEESEYSGEFFRDGLGEILGLEIPPSVEDVISSLRIVSL